MKIIHLWFTILFAAATARAVDKPVVNSSNAIPWNQIGAKAGADYKGDGLAVTATDSGARLHCIFQRLDGEATPEGLWLTSTAAGANEDRLRVIAVAVGRKDLISSTTLPGTGNIIVDGQTVRLSRDGLTEEYSVSMDGIRQDFIVEEPLDNRRMGELVVQLEVNGAKVEQAVDGAQLVLERSGRKIAYSRLRATDAKGKELPARIEIASDSALHTPHSAFGLTLVVDDTDALYPIRIDPTFSDANWVTISQYVGADGCVQAAVTDGSGNLYIAGGFSGVGACLANNIAKWDGTNWTTLGSGMNGGINALVLSGSTLYAGGGFTTAGGVAANNVAQWDGTNWSPLGSGILGAQVNALAISGNNLYAGGNFTNAGGVAANCGARWDGSSWSALGSGMNDQVNALAFSGGTLYAGGRFTNAGGVSANYVAQWNGTSWLALGSGMDGWVDALASFGGTLYAAGGFGTAGGNAITNIAQWNGSTWATVGSGFDNQVNVLVVSGGTLYAGGYFAMAGTVPVNGIAQWNGSAWLGVGSGVDGQVNAIAVSGNTIYAGGCFGQAGGRPAANIAEWSSNSWSPMGFGLDEILGGGFSAPTFANALAISSNKLVAGGQFNYVGNIPVGNIVLWSNGVWSALGDGVGGDVISLAVLGNKIYAGGWFGQAGSVAVNNIAQWDGTNWSALGTGLPVPFSHGAVWVDALAVSGNKLYAGGGFTTAGGISANHVAQWDGTNWSALGSGMNSSVFVLAASSNLLYAGGNFTSAGGVAANYIAQWDGTNWSALGPGVNDQVYALAISGGKLFVGGHFTIAGSSAVGHIAEWDGTNWSALSSGMDGGVNALIASGGSLYAAGGFNVAGGVPAQNIAQWDGNNWSPLGSGMNNLVTSLAVDGSALYAGGWFSLAGSKIASCLSKAILPNSVLILTSDGNFGITNGTFGFNVSGPSGSNVIIKSSVDLQSWAPLQTNQFDTNGLYYFSDTQPPSNARRFYRAVLP